MIVNEGQNVNDVVRGVREVAEAQRLPEQVLLALAPHMYRRWVCFVVRTHYHGDARCTSTEPHVDRWGCGYRYELFVSLPHDDREVVMTEVQRRADVEERLRPRPRRVGRVPHEWEIRERARLGRLGVPDPHDL